MTKIKPIIGFIYIGNVQVTREEVFGYCMFCYVENTSPFGNLDRIIARPTLKTIIDIVIMSNKLRIYAFSNYESCPQTSKTIFGQNLFLKNTGIKILLLIVWCR